MASKGIIELMMENVGSEDYEVQYQSCAAIANLAIADSNRQKIYESFFDTLEEVIVTENQIAQSECAKIVSNLCLNGIFYSNLDK